VSELWIIVASLAGFIAGMLFGFECATRAVWRLINYKETRHVQ